MNLPSIDRTAPAAVRQRLRDLGLNSRLRWNPRAGENLYFVVNYNFDSGAGAFRELNSTQSEIVVKYTRNFRF